MEQKAKATAATTLPGPAEAAKPSPTVERLRIYLRQLTPKAQAMLAREFERVLADGKDTAVATLVLGELRGLLRPPEASQVPRLDVLSRTVFAALEPFLVDVNEPQPGQIRRASLPPLWAWLIGQGLPKQAIALADLVAGTDTDGASADVDLAIRKFQLEAAELIHTMAKPSPENPDGPRALARIGGPALVEDVLASATVLQHYEALKSLQARMPGFIRTFGESQVASVRGTLAQLPTLQQPALIPFVLALLVNSLSAPWQIIRLAISVAGSDEEGRVAASPLGIAVPMALHELSDVVAQLRSETKRGQFEACAHHLKTLHDGVRDLRTELDLRADSAWSRKLATIRIDISKAVTAEVESVPGRVRRLLRQRPDKEITSATKLDRAEADETAALINFVAVCRTYANELAINEVTLRSYTDVQHYVEVATETLVESLRSCDPRVRSFRKSQVEVAIRFCEIIFGHDYASLMAKAAEVAFGDERKASRAD